MIPLALSLALASGVLPSDPVTPVPDAIELSFRSRRNFAFALPEETWSKLGTSFPSADPKHPGYGVLLDGGILRIDTDADGTPDVEVAGKEALVTLRDADGVPNAAVRLKRGNQGWQWSTAGTRVGKIGNIKVQLIDQNNDGRYDGVGSDAMIVGRGDDASYLSEVIAVAGQLYTLDVDPDGSRLTLAAYDGPAGTLDLVSEQDCDAKLAWAVVQSTDGRYSFDLSKAREGQAVPAGEYTLVRGRVALGKNHASIQRGRSKAMNVPADGALRVAWGGPVAAEFGVERAPGQLGFSPTEIDYYGSLGELYTDFLPLGKSPEFSIKDAKTGEVLVNAKFPGNC